MALSTEVIEQLQIDYMNAKSKIRDKMTLSKTDVKFILENVDNWLDTLSPMLANPETTPFGGYLSILSFKEMTEFLYLIEKARVLQVDGIINF